MRRAQNRSTRTQSGAQPAQRSTGDVSDRGGDVSGTGADAGATSTTLRDQPASSTEPTSTSYGRETAPPGYATAGRTETTERTGLGGVTSILAGMLAFLAGLALIVRNHFYPSLPGYAYHLPVDSWGWVLLALGILLFAAGSSHLLGLPFGRVAAIAFALLTAIAGFMVLPYTPFWSILIVALSAVALWALLRRNRSEDARMRSMRM